MANTLWREPIQLVAGDTLAFNRSLPDYPASQGWSLLYELRGGAQPISFQSTPINGDAHSLSVDAATTATWLAGDYVLSGFAINGAERHRIYYASCPIRPNAVAEPGDVPKQTFTQKMIANLEAVMLGSASDDLLESRIGDTQFRYLSPLELRTEYAFWKEIRRQEVARQRAANGLPTGNKIRPLFKVKSPGPSAGQFGFGTGYQGW